MMNFTQWAESNKHNIKAVFTDSAPATKKTVDEKTKRSGIRGQYPDGYVRSQYPDNYFMPISATAALDLQNAKSTKSVADKGGSPL